MLIQAVVQTPIPGQLDRFNRFLQMNIALATAHGVGTSVKVSSFGTAGIEIYLMQQFANWEEYGEKTDAMRTDPVWRQIMDFGAAASPLPKTSTPFAPARSRTLQPRGLLRGPGARHGVGPSPETARRYAGSLRPGQSGARTRWMQGPCFPNPRGVSAASSSTT